LPTPPLPEQIRMVRAEVDVTDPQGVEAG
jgi:hypothetical protein